MPLKIVSQPKSTHPSQMFFIPITPAFYSRHGPPAYPRSCSHFLFAKRAAVEIKGEAGKENQIHIRR